MPRSEPTHPGPAVSVLHHWIGRLYLWLHRWRVEGEAPEHPQAVFIAAPHTSSWDMTITIACSWVLRIRPSWAGRRELFRWPWGWVLRRLGGVPVDRRGGRGAVPALAALYQRYDKLFLGIAPSGARRYRDHWRSGFYHVARLAGVPIYCGYLDYRRRVGGLGFHFWPGDDLVADMDRIRAFYADKVGRNPEWVSRIWLKEEGEASRPARGAGA